MPEQLALVPVPPCLPEPEPPQTYWECRGPHDWRPVVLVVGFGDSRGMPVPVFPLARTRPLGPRNVAIRREGGEIVVRPVRSLRCRKPGEAP